MLSMNASEQTPCGAMFDVLKRHGGISHKELATLILSERPLSDGRSPASRAADRTWVSRFVVHAPVGSIQPRYFRDYGVAAQRVLDRLRAGRGLSSEDVLKMICGEPGDAMVRALSACHQDVRLYQNAMVRLRDGEGYTANERVEAAMVLFVAAGCSANARLAVDYAMNYIRTVLGGRLGTPSSRPVPLAHRDPALGQLGQRAMGLVRITDGCITSDPYWIDPQGDGVEIGALVTGGSDIADVDGDVSSRHARMWFEPAPAGGDDPVQSGRWLLRDLGSSNGTDLTSGDTGASRLLVPGEDAEVHPGDEVRLGATTTFVLVEGAVNLVR